MVSCSLLIGGKSIFRRKYIGSTNTVIYSSICAWPRVKFESHAVSLCSGLVAARCWAWIWPGLESWIHWPSLYPVPLTANRILCERNKGKERKKGKKNTKLLAYLSFLRLLSPPKGILTYYHISFIVEKKLLNSFTIVFCEGLFCLMRNIIDSVE